MIKPILYMAVSANGFINDAEGRTPWCDSEWSRYSRILQQARCLIVGRRTHEIMEKYGEYQRLKVERVVVLSSSIMADAEGITVAATPDIALQTLENEGFRQVVIGGGALVNTAFLAAGKIREIYLDIEPLLFGSGLPLLNAVPDLTLKLTLDAIDRYAPNSIGIKYSVV